MFGKWKVLSKERHPKNGRWTLKCECECGSISYIPKNCLEKGESKSCFDCRCKDQITRHQLEMDLIGKNLGDWTVISFDSIKKVKTEHCRMFKCKCRCGVERLVKGSDLKKLINRKCLSCFSEARKIVPYDNIWNKILYRAKERNLDINITKEFAFNLLENQSFKCALSGLDIVIANGSLENNRGKSTISLDRIDSKKGYTEGNVQWTHKEINLMKWDLDELEFIYFCKLISEKNKSNG